MSERSSPRPRRRAVLAACGTGLAALAGCSSIDLDDEDRDYDVGRLSDVATAEGPRRPDAFPVAVTGAMLDRHHDRAEALVSAVPERPTVANGVVTRRLRREREHVVQDLEGDRDDDESETGLGRLSHARHVRSDAAELDGAYRAATGEIDREAVAERESALRADLLTFEAEWDYRGGAPALALAVHAEIESLRRGVRRDAEAWPSIPADPATDPFRVGRRVGDLESGRAALGDAGRIRRGYLAGVDEPRSLRAAITGAAHRLEERVGWERRWADDYLDTGSGEPPFDRPISDTPAERLYHRAQVHADAHPEDARRALREGDPASAALANARGLSSLETLSGVVDAIQAGKYGPPEDVDAVARVHGEAVSAAEAALETEPAAVTVEVAFPATEGIQSGRYYLERADGDGHGVHAALAEFVFAERYARSVPGAVGAVVDALGDGG